MRKMLLAVLALTVAGCSEGLEDTAERWVKMRLNDPESAQFSHVETNKDTKTVCGFVNARNAFGGYTGDRMWVYRDYTVTLQEDAGDREAMLAFMDLWSQCRS
jgi:hypothetical protein